MCIYLETVQTSSNINNHTAGKLHHSNSILCGGLEHQGRASYTIQFFVQFQEWVVWEEVVSRCILDMCCNKALRALNIAKTS